MSNKGKGILVELVLLPIELALAVLVFALSFVTIGLTGILAEDEEWMLAPFILTWHILSFGYYVTVFSKEELE